LNRVIPVAILSAAGLLSAPGAESGANKPKPPAPPQAAPAKPAAAPAASAPAVATKLPPEQEKALRERVNEYWSYRGKANLHACYPYYEAAFRKKYTADQFAVDFRRLNRFAPEFLGVDEIVPDPSGAKATVKMKLRTHPDVLQGQELISPVEETWMLEDGVWNRAGELTFPSL
jgi:hypothetical protein